MLSSPSPSSAPNAPVRRLTKNDKAILETSAWAFLPLTCNSKTRFPSPIARRLFYKVSWPMSVPFTLPRTSLFDFCRVLPVVELGGQRALPPPLCVWKDNKALCKAPKDCKGSHICAKSHHARWLLDCPNVCT